MDRRNFFEGPPEKRIFILSLQRMLAIKSHKTVWSMGDAIRKVMAERNAYYKRAGVIKRENIDFGSPKSGKRGR